MASLSDIRPVLREVGYFPFVRRVWKEMSDDHVFIYASALSYSWLFAFFPMLVFMLSLIPFLPSAARVKGEQMIYDSIRSNFPKETATWVLSNTKVKTVLEGAINNRRGTLLSVSLLIALWAASNGISAVMTSLDRCYDLDQGRPYYRGKPLSLLLTIVLTGLVLVLMTMMPVATIVERYLRHNYATIPFTHVEIKMWFRVAFNFARYFVGLGAAFLILSIVYNFCPSVKMRWRLVTPGALFCFLAWVAIGMLFRFYFDATGGTMYAQTFGPAAGLAMLLLSFYLYGVVLLVGAEINAEIDHIRLKAPVGTRDLRPYEKDLARREKAGKPAAPTPPKPGDVIPFKPT